jgi:hypothetical protein
VIATEAELPNGFEGEPAETRQVEPRLASEYPLVTI